MMFISKNRGQGRCETLIHSLLTLFMRQQLIFTKPISSIRLQCADLSRCLGLRSSHENQRDLGSLVTGEQKIGKIDRYTLGRVDGLGAMLGKMMMQPIQRLNIELPESAYQALEFYCL